MKGFLFGIGFICAFSVLGMEQDTKNKVAGLQNFIKAKKLKEAQNLLKEIEDPNAITNENARPFIVCVADECGDQFEKWIPFCNALLEKNANLNQRDAEGRTALSICQEKKFSEMESWLKKQPAEVMDEESLEQIEYRSDGQDRKMKAVYGIAIAGGVAFVWYLGYMSSFVVCHYL